MNKRISIFILLVLIIITITVEAAKSSNIAPQIENINIIDITDTSATLTFTVDQIDANVIVHYGTKSGSLGMRSDWNNDTSTSRAITLSGLSNGKKYYFSIYGYNGSDSSKSSHSSTDSFTTTTVIAATAPLIENININGITTSTANIAFTVDQNDANTRIYYGTTESLGTWSDWDNKTSFDRNIMLSGLTNGTNYYLSIYAYNSGNQSFFTNSNIANFTTTESIIPTPTPTTAPLPSTVSTSPETATIHTIGNKAASFSVSFDQNVDIKWFLNNINVQENNSVSSAIYVNNTPSVGTWNLTAMGENSNGTISYSWTWIVDPELSHTGNRIWDGSKGMSSDFYIWDSYSFSGFYYDLDTNISTENLQINNIQSSISTGNIVYKTSPVEVDFQHSAFGKYQVIGFMADKYFAGYTTNSVVSNNKAMSTIANGQLQKVLFDDDDKRTISEGGTLTLGEGYVLKMKEVDVGAGAGQIWLVLLKDGNEVDNAVVAGGGDYIYTKKVGSTQDLPIIAIHFDSVFRGTEVNAAFVKGVFQISETINSIKSGDDYGVMEVSTVGSDQITMENRNSVGLSPGDTIDLMGNLKIIVANSDTLRFALSVNRTGEFEVRGTIYPVVTNWTPMNFGLNVGDTNIGFYYDLDEDIGTEDLKLQNIDGSTIPDGGLIYSTSPQEVSFSYDGFGKYEVIGFMADKYFAGYTSNTNPPSPSVNIKDQSTISQGQLHKILIDDENQRTISVGGTLTMKEGYVLKAIDIDSNARTMLLALLKDGNEIDETPLSAGQTYVYTKKVGAVNDLPLIMMRFDSVFSGAEVQAAFIKGLFQISDTPTSVKTGDNFGSMEISSVTDNGIEMNNPNSIGLSAGNTVDLMGDIQFKVADSGDVRFYPFVLVTQAMIANQLMVSAPNRATGGDTIKINVTAGGAPVDGVSIDIEPNIGTIGNLTNIDGVVNYTFPIKSQGIYNITASKLGYEDANTSIEIERYIVDKLNINVPLVIDQYETIPIQITSNGTNISGAIVSYDNTTIGTTDSNGYLNYSFGISGNHTISASKDGFISVSLSIDVRAPYSEFQAQDINIVPNSTFIGENVLIVSNITNVGTKGDTKTVNLIINGSTVDNKSITLDQKDTKEINFTYKASGPKGNYSVEILGQKKLLSVNEKPYNILFLGAILTVIGVFVIYVATNKEKTMQSIDLLVKRIYNHKKS